MGQILTEYRGRTAVITVDNPPLNTLNTDLLTQLRAAFAAVMDSDATAVVLTGAGEKAFVAGADITQFPSLNTREDAAAFVRYGQAIWEEIAAFPLPVICAVEGYALGGGTELALACDIRVASERAKFGLPEITLGILPGYGGTQRLPRLVGAGMAKKLLLSGQHIDAREAYRIGLVETLTPVGEALNGALALAARIGGACAPLAAREIKRVVNEGLDCSLRESIELEARAFGRLCVTRDKNEGVAAFLEKRTPAFQGE